MKMHTQWRDVVALAVRGPHPLGSSSTPCRHRLLGCVLLLALLFSHISGSLLCSGGGIVGLRRLRRLLLLLLCHGAAVDEP